MATDTIDEAKRLKAVNYVMIQGDLEKLIEIVDTQSQKIDNAISTPGKFTVKFALEMFTEDYGDVLLGTLIDKFSNFFTTDAQNLENYTNLQDIIEKLLAERSEMRQKHLASLKTTREKEQAAITLSQELSARLEAETAAKALLASELASTKAAVTEASEQLANKEATQREASAEVERLKSANAVINQELQSKTEELARTSLKLREAADQVLESSRAAEELEKLCNGNSVQISALQEKIGEAERKAEAQALEHRSALENALREERQLHATALKEAEKEKSDCEAELARIREKLAACVKEHADNNAVIDRFAGIRAQEASVASAKKKRVPPISRSPLQPSSGPTVSSKTAESQTVPVARIELGRATDAQRSLMLDPTFAYEDTDDLAGDDGLLTRPVAPSKPRTSEEILADIDALTDSRGVPFLPQTGQPTADERAERARALVDAVRRGEGSPTTTIKLDPNRPAGSRPLSTGRRRPPTHPPTEPPPSSASPDAIDAAQRQVRPAPRIPPSPDGNPGSLRRSSSTTRGNIGELTEHLQNIQGNGFRPFYTGDFTSTPSGYRQTERLASAFVPEDPTARSSAEVPPPGQRLDRRLRSQRGSPQTNFPPPNFPPPNPGSTGSNLGRKLTKRRGKKAAKNTRIFKKRRSTHHKKRKRNGFTIRL